MGEANNYTIAPKVRLSTATAVTPTSDTSLTTGIYPLFTQARDPFEEQRPGHPGARWAVIDPDNTSLLLQDTEHFVRAGELDDKIVQYGLIGGEEVARTAAEAPGFIRQDRRLHRLRDSVHDSVVPAESAKRIVYLKTTS